jgi:hypothetical protein
VKELQAFLLPESEKEMPTQAAPEAVISVKPDNSILENIIGRSDQTSETKAMVLATQLKNRSISAEDFIKYYTERTAGGATGSKDQLRQLQETITKANSGTAQERGMAQRALTVIAQRLMKDIAAGKK